MLVEVVRVEVLRLFLTLILYIPTLHTLSLLYPHPFIIVCTAGDLSWDIVMISTRNGHKYKTNTLPVFCFLEHLL